jgi:hypothetical protein
MAFVAEGFGWSDHLVGSLFRVFAIKKESACLPKKKAAQNKRICRATKAFRSG